MKTDFRAALLEAVADPDCDVARAALYMAADDCEGVDVDASLARIDDLGAALAEQADNVRSSTVVTTLGALLREQLNLHGAGGGDPQAHYLHTVLQRGAGVPIACSVIWMAVARRAGCDADGVGLPGHFVVRINGSLVDPFVGGEVLDDSAARRIVGRTLGNEPDHLDPVWLMPSPTRAIVGRMSRNLRGCYVARENWDLALHAADRCVELLPDHAGELRDRGMLRWRLGHLSGAAQDLQCYLDRASDAHDRAAVEGVLSKVRSSLN